MLSSMDEVIMLLNNESKKEEENDRERLISDAFYLFNSIFRKSLFYHVVRMRHSFIKVSLVNILENDDVLKIIINNVKEKEDILTYITEMKLLNIFRKYNRLVINRVEKKIQYKIINNVHTDVIFYVIDDKDKLEYFNFADEKLLKLKSLIKLIERIIILKYLDIIEKEYIKEIKKRIGGDV